MTMTDVERVRLSVGSQLGSRVKVRVNKGRHKVALTEGVIKAAYPSVFTIQIDRKKSDTPRTMSFTYTDVITKDVQMMLCE